MIKRFFSTLAATVYNPAFYAKARGGGLDTPIRYTAALGLIGASLVALIIFIAIIPFSRPGFLDKVTATYPDDLVITIAHGALSINQPEPYYVRNTLNAEGPKYLAVFDTDDSLTGGPGDNGAYVLVKKTYAIAQGGSGGEQTTYFNKIATSSTTTISKADVKKFIDKIRPFAGPVVIAGGLLVAIFGAIVVAALWFGYHLAYVLIPSALIYLCGRFREPALLWRESYIVALYASMPVAIATYLVHFAGLEWPIFFYTLLVIIVAIVNLFKARSG